MISKQLLKILCLFSTLSFVFISKSFANEWIDQFTFGGGLGVGFTDIAKDVSIEGTTQNAKRGESPLVAQFLIEYDLNSKWTLGLRHSRGARLSPFSTGIGFTGLVVRRYFSNKRPYLPSKRAKDRVTVMNWAPFLGLSTGFAVANTEREREVIANVDSSGFFIGVHLGVDYHMFANFIFRPELIYATTLFDATEQPATISQMGLVLNVMFKL